MVPDAVLMDTQEELTDLLDRKAFVARLIDVVEILSENRKNASFAVNGAWGVGKTFVLNRFEEEIAKYPLEEDGPRKYLVFHYDCWKYDYYEEPLIALVAALTDSIDKQTNFISADKRTTFKVVLKEIIAGLVEVGSVKTGFDIKKIFETIKSARNKATQEIADSHDFDVYFSFNCILEKLRAAIKDLAEEQTILLVVDELDRCLPEYTITVLERLHHVLEGIPNVQTIISIDKEQLECTVRQIYGCNTNAKRYLEKFISFEITLREGSLEDRADPLFERYYGKLQCNTKLCTPEEVSEFKRIILEGINTRSRLELIEKSSLLYRLVSREEDKSDAVFACIGMFLTVLKFYELDVKKAKEDFQIRTLFEPLSTYHDKRGGAIPMGLAHLREKYTPDTSEEDLSPTGTKYMHHKQTILGPAWAIIQPLLTTVVFTLVFGNIAGLSPDGVPPFIFYLSGTVLWTYFAGCLTQTANTFVANSATMGKVYFPRLVMPISTVFSELISFAIQYGFLLIFLVYYTVTKQGVHPNLWMLMTPLIILQLAMLSLGCGIIISALTTKYRDLAMLVGFGVQLWMYGSPIAYDMFRFGAFAPGGKWHALYMCNPISPIVNLFRYAYLGTGAMEWSYYLIGWGTTLGFLFLGIVLFSRVEKTFMDTV